MSPGEEKRGPTALGVALIVLCVLGILGGIVWSYVSKAMSPAAVRTELHAAKKAYVGTWNTKDHAVSLRIEASGDVYYDESSSYRASKGEAGDLEDDSTIEAFMGDDIAFRSGRRIKVTSPPHDVDGHVVMTADGMSFERE